MACLSQPSTPSSSPPAGYPWFNPANLHGRARTRLGRAPKASWDVANPLVWRIIPSVLFAKRQCLQGAHERPAPIPWAVSTVSRFLGPSRLPSIRPSIHPPTLPSSGRSTACQPQRVALSPSWLSAPPLPSPPPPAPALGVFPAHTQPARSRSSYHRGGHAPCQTSCAPTTPWHCTGRSLAST